MSKLFYKAMIEGIQNDKCTDAELEALLNNFKIILIKLCNSITVIANVSQDILRVNYKNTVIAFL